MIRLAKPNISEEAINAVAKVLRSGNLVQGRNVEEFEKKLCNYLEVDNAIVVSSGTAALHLSLQALNIKKGDEVIIPAFTFPATANVVELVGAKPVFVDINLDDFCINTDLIEASITDKTVAIMPVHEFGQAAKIDNIVALCKKHNLKLVEDAACAFGTEYSDQKVGTFGDLGCFSFHPRKAITTGEGGVIITNNNELSKKIRALRNHGMETENNSIEFNYAGFNYRMTDFQAVLGVYQLDEFDKQIEIRTKLAEEYNKLLKDIDWIITPKLFENRRMTYQTYHVLVKDRIDRDKLIEYLYENGVQANYGAQAVNVQRYYNNKYHISVECLPNSFTAFTKGIALPIGDFLSNGNILSIISILKNYG